MDEWPADPHHDWPSHFRAGDGVRLSDGRPGVVIVVQDYAPDPPSRWELIVRSLDPSGNPDDFIVDPWECRPDPSAVDELPSPGGS